LLAQETVTAEEFPPLLQAGAPRSLEKVVA
jgi:hypothetical protein